MNPPTIGERMGAIDTMMENQARRLIMAFLSGWSPIHICELSKANPAEKAWIQRPMLKNRISLAEPQRIHPKKQHNKETCKRRFLEKRSQMGPKNKKLSVRQK